MNYWKLHIGETQYTSFTLSHLGQYQDPFSYIGLPTYKCACRDYNQSPTSFEKSPIFNPKSEQLNRVATLLHLWQALNPSYAPPNIRHCGRRGRPRAVPYRYQQGKWHWIKKAHHVVEKWRALQVRSRISTMRAVLRKSTARKMKTTIHGT